MTAIADHERFGQPMVKRLGLDDGWWFFCPHFLNLGIPLVFIDACLLTGVEQLGLETLGTRTPATPFPSVDLHVRLLGNGVSLYSASPEHHFVTGHWFRKLRLPQALNASIAGIVVGDSYALQLSWSALWTCRAGSVAVERPAQ